MLEAFGKYLLLEKIASGGMAEVYLAKSIGANGINKFVAIKRILPQYSDNPEFIDMFKEEAKIAVNLNHGNVVSIFDFGVEKGQFFLVMEFVEGQNLRQILNHMKKETKDFTIDQITYVTKEVAAGLDHAHRCLDGATGRPLNITHRDMSPQNVMISFEGEIKVVDFGIAKAENQMEQTRAGTIKGKFGYMSPEQADGQAVDLRTDIFSLGICLWELLAKDRLFVGQSEAATLRKVRECQIPSLRKINPSIPPELERICNKALAKDRSLRYQTAAAFHKDLNRFLNLQYPEFSAQEFSKFMKSLYNRMYVENRKKFAEFAKIQFEDERTSVTENTATLTSTETESSLAQKTKSELSIGAPPPTLQVGKQAPRVVAPKDSSINNNDESLDIDMMSKKIDMAGLKTAVSQIPGRSSRVEVQLKETGRPTTTTISRPRAKIPDEPARESTGKHQARSGSMTPAVVAVSFVALGLYFILGSNPETGSGNKTVDDIVCLFKDCKTTGPGKINQASSMPAPIVISSEPIGATVFIDGQNKGLTPYSGWVEVNRPFKLTLVKDGFVPADIGDIKAHNTDLLKIRKVLQPEPPMGYISIDAVNAGSDPVISVNGRIVTEKLPIQRYQVPAGVPAVIRVTNPLAKVSAEQTITVQVGQKIPIRLILRPDRNANTR